MRIWRRNKTMMTGRIKWILRWQKGLRCYRGEWLGRFRGWMGSLLLNYPWYSLSDDGIDERSETNWSELRAWIRRFQRGCNVVFKLFLFVENFLWLSNYSTCKYERYVPPSTIPTRRITHRSNCGDLFFLVKYNMWLLFGLLVGQKKTSWKSVLFSRTKRNSKL